METQQACGSLTTGIDEFLLTSNTAALSQTDIVKIESPWNWKSFKSLRHSEWPVIVIKNSNSSLFTIIVSLSELVLWPKNNKIKLVLVISGRACKAVHNHNCWTEFYSIYRVSLNWVVCLRNNQTYFQKEENNLMFIEAPSNLKKTLVISYLCAEYERCKYEMFWHSSDSIDWKTTRGLDKYRTTDENAKRLSLRQVPHF